MGVRIIARKVADGRLEAGDILTVRDISHQWTATEQAQIGKLWVEIVVNENPPNDPGYYKQPLADLELRAVDGGAKDVSDGRAIVRRDVVLATFPWDGENTPKYQMEKAAIKAKARFKIVQHKTRRFKVSVVGVRDQATFKTWADFQATLTDKRGV